MTRELTREDVKVLIKKFSGTEMTDAMMDSLETQVPNFTKDIASMIGDMHTLDISMKKIDEAMKHSDLDDVGILKKLENIEKGLNERLMSFSKNEKDKPSGIENSFGVDFTAEVIKPKDISDDFIYVITNNKTNEKSVVNNRKELTDFLSASSCDIDNFTIKKAKVG